MKYGNIGSAAHHWALNNNTWVHPTSGGYILALATTGTTLTGTNNVFQVGGTYAQKVVSVATPYSEELWADTTKFNFTYNYLYSEDAPFTNTTYDCVASANKTACRTTFSNLILSSNVVPYIPPTNWFAPPYFTTVGSDWTLHAGSLIAQRGTTVNVPGNLDRNGVAFGANDVGAYANPAQTALPALNALSVGWYGDSIMSGYNATAGSESYSFFTTYNPSLTAINYGIPGQFSTYQFWDMDQSIFLSRNSTAILDIGINDLISKRNNQTNAQVSSNIINMLTKVSNAGIRPIWLGITSKMTNGGDPDNSDIAAVCNSVDAAAAAAGWSYDRLLDRMTNFNPNWKDGTYYLGAGTAGPFYNCLIAVADCTGHPDLHLNDSGQSFIASVADNLYNRRSDYYVSDSNYGTSDPVTPSVAGDGLLWASATYQRPITVAGLNASSGIHPNKDISISSLEANKYYNLTLDGGITNLSGTNCNTIGLNYVCKSNSSGEVIFHHTTTYASHTFAILGDNTAPTTTASIGTGNYDTVQTVTLTCSDGSGLGCDKTYYTLDGSTPTTSSSEYSSSLITPLNTVTTLKFFSIDNNDNQESVQTKTYAVGIDLTETKLNVSGESDELKDETHAKENRLTLKGKDPSLANGIVEIYKKGKLWKTLTANYLGAWKKTLALKDDFFGWIKLKFFSQSGLEIASRRSFFKVDTEDPTFITFPPDNKVIYLNYQREENRTLIFQAKDNQKIDKYKIEFN
ncbi:MAG: chitobiase/beta-hexosaminidase C-terminal domain-containing protein, partial [Patescibacteria group bacterium]